MKIGWLNGLLKLGKLNDLLANINKGVAEGWEDLRASASNVQD